MNNNSTRLPGSKNKRVYISGDIENFGSRLNDIAKAVIDCGLCPIDANKYIRKGTERLFSRRIIKQCKYAIFETSNWGRPFFELDYVRDFSVLCLCVRDSTYKRRKFDAISSHPVFINNSRPYSDGVTLQTAIFDFIGYNPYHRLSEGAVQIFIDDIDSFDKVRQVESSLVKDIVPLALSEQQIKKYFADIIGEPFVLKDWGGEDYDLLSSHVKYEGKRIPTGFIFKGPGVGRKSLTISCLGKNGNQIVKLTRIAQDLYIVQFVGFIHNDVIDHLDAHARRAGRQRNKLIWYCAIDGTDTARLLRAHNLI